MIDRDLGKRPDVRHRIPRTPEQERAHNLQVARGALTGFSVFDHIEETGQTSVVDYTAEVAAYIKRRHGGHYRSTSSDVSWSVLDRVNPTEDSAFGKFKLALGVSAAHLVYKTLYALLQEGVTTKEALVKKSAPPPDLLEGMTGLKAAKGREFRWGK